MHAAVHCSMTYGCQLVKQPKFMQKCINYLVMSLDGIIIFSHLSPLRPPPPPWVRTRVCNISDEQLSFAVFFSEFVFFFYQSVLVVSPSPPSPPPPTTKKKKRQKQNKAKTQMRGPYPGPYSLFEAIYGICF